MYKYYVRSIIEYIQNEEKAQCLTSDMKFIAYSYTSNETFLQGKLMSEMRKESWKF